ncbi:thioredoxin domain-containing protein [Actinomadura sp. LD22]|uniref:Thioredoxin domain-containing protein n=1 Tax=Actinomadura physcomitrii TaxID=2650748 RepID=A0A6I4M6H8_9ACTN|nr:thioredoxin domain-containing protein [Actinomadura physcomitrii]MWA01182.1 thioredoxin domain-containing protein [Actinomadura physcomitrii]
MGNPPTPPWPDQGPQPPYGPPPVPPNAPGPGQPGPGPVPPVPPGGAPPPGVPMPPITVPPPGGQPWQPGPPPPPRRGPGLLIALIAGGLVLVLAAVVAVVVLTGDDGGDGGDRADGGGSDGTSLQVGKIAGGAEAIPNADGSLTMARPGVTSPVVDIYEDFSCPPCGNFDRTNDPMLKQVAVAGEAKVVFHPMVIFGEGTEPQHGNSTRAASALRCVREGARWLSYQDALYAHQPSESTQGYATSDLLDWAAPLGLTGDDFRSCVTGQRYASDVGRVSQTYISTGVQGTPSVRVNGRLLDSSDTQSPDALRRAIEAAS